MLNYEAMYNSACCTDIIRPHRALGAGLEYPVI